MTLTVQDLGIARGGRPILDNLSFSLAPGEALILRGPNGSGKTTLLRTLAGLQPPLAGSIDGTEDQVAYAGHADGIKLTLTVRENLMFWAQVFGGHSIDAAVKGYDLAALVDRVAGTLSAGQKRRLGLARMMVTGRHIWILDEPTVSLDAASVHLFAGSVESHLATGGIAVLATHIDLGLPNARVLDIAPFRAAPRPAHQDEAFL